LLSLKEKMKTIIPSGNNESVSFLFITRFTRFDTHKL
jgi:hypothetical protein